MNISKINSASFRGYLTIQHKDEAHTFNTKNISAVKNSSKDGGMIIEGKEEPFETKTKLLIPYTTISANTVKAAYKAACQTKKAEIILKMQ